MLMDLFNNKKITALTTKLELQSSSIENLTNALTYGDYRLFDGEKTEGELGRAEVVFPDYETAGERAWELQLTNDIAKLVMNKWITWLIGKGLRFNATPPKDRIPGLNREEFIDIVEYRFRNYLNSKYCDYSEMVDFHTQEAECDYNALVRGDILCILRVEDKRVTRQLIDGANVQSPFKYTGTNNILDGVEYDKKGRHVAYWVWNDEGIHQRIEAIHKQTGLKMAFLVYGSKFRLNETRGLPMLIEDYEKIKNLDRYIGATVKNAEVSSELILVNEHDATSTGENVLKGNVLKKLASTGDVDPGIPNASCFKDTLTKMTKGVALNNTIGGKIKMLKPNAENTMPDFLVSNLKLVFGSAGIPYEVAISVYNSNYSASRAAIKDWEHNLQVKTNYIAKQTYQPFYELWLYNEVLLGNVDAFQLVQAYRKKDYVTIAAINKATFTGVAVPSIDPLKEVKAVRESLGPNFEGVSLMTGEQATEIISQKDYDEIQEQVKEEIKIAVKPVVKPTGNELQIS